MYVAQILTDNWWTISIFALFKSQEEKETVLEEAGMVVEEVQGQTEKENNSDKSL